jgi:hypothetical protein
LLRPESVESFYLLWKVTGDPRYQEWAWQVRGVPLAALPQPRLQTLLYHAASLLRKLSVVLNEEHFAHDWYVVACFMSHHRRCFELLRSGPGCGPLTAIASAPPAKLPRRSEQPRLLKRPGVWSRRRLLMHSPLLMLPRPPWRI